MPFMIDDDSDRSGSLAPDEPGRDASDTDEASSPGQGMPVMEAAGSESASYPEDAENDSDLEASAGGLLDVEASESGTEQEDASEDASDDGSSGDEPGNFIDLEASEADDESRSDAESSSDAGAGLFDMEAADSGDEMSSESDQGELHYFPQFCRLPIELRQRVWQLFCPDLMAPARVVSLRLTDLSSWSANPMNTPYQFWEDATTDHQTRPARAVLATHQESREFALRQLPDTLELYEGGGVVRLNKETDIVYLRHIFPDQPPAAEDWTPFNGIKHVAMGEDWRCLWGNTLGVNFLALFPDVEVLYFPVSRRERHMRSLLWCGAPDTVNRYLVEMFEEEAGLGMEIQSMYCWPDLAKHHDFARNNIPVGLFTSAADKGAVPTMVSHEDGVHTITLENGHSGGQTKTVEVWPLVEFQYERGLALFHRCEEWWKQPNDWESDDSTSWSESGSDLARSNMDEYESEGIDDSEIEQVWGSSDEEDDLAVQPVSDDHSSFGGFSPPQEATFDADEVTGYPTAHFSSPEPQGAAANGPDASTSDGEGAPVARRPKRRIVTSDSEGGSDVEERPNKLARLANRRRAVMSDSEDENEDDDEPRGSCAAHAEDPADEEDGNEDDESRDDAAEGSEEDSEADAEQHSEEDSEEEARPLSFFEKLQQHREENAVPPYDDERDSEEPSGDDYDGRNFVDCQDDEGDGELGSAPEYEDEDELPGEGMITDEGDEDDGAEEW